MMMAKSPNSLKHPNPMYLEITPSEERGRGHFHLAENRTSLLCVDNSSARVDLLLRAN